MTCDGEYTDSIWSQYTDYGASHSKKSIWNMYGVYGSFTSNFSPYNPKAKYPPRVINGNGKCIGYLTVNKNNPNRLTDSVADLICFNREVILKGGVDGYAELFIRKY